MVPQELLTIFFDQSIRVDTLIHIGSQMLDESLPSVVKDVFDSDIDNIAVALNVDADELANDYSAGDISWDMRRKYKRQGYLVQFATPVPITFSQGGESHTHSWGAYTYVWLYGETLEECCKSALEWRSEYISTQRRLALTGSDGDGEN